MHTVKIHFITEDKHPRSKTYYKVADIYTSIYLGNILLLFEDGHAIIVELTDSISAIEIDDKLHEL